MLRSAVITLLVAPVLALSTTAYAASPTTLFAEVTKHGPKGTTITLTEGVRPAGSFKITRCAKTSPTAFVCSGTGTVIIGDVSYGPAKVRVRWKCPVGKPCAKKAEGTLKNNGSTLALLHVRTTVGTFQTRDSAFGIDVELVGE
jgi:hypothetical protein